MTTPSGTKFAMLPPHGSESAATLLLLAMSDVDSLTIEPYCRVGRLLHARGWNVVSLDLPCHGADQRAGEAAELDGWAARTAAGEDFVAPFRAQVNDVIRHLVTTGIADPARLAVAGTSRGGFMAFHAAAGCLLIMAVAAFAPVTNLLALREFAGQEGNSLVDKLSLLHAVPALAGRAAWIIIGDADERVGTDQAVALARARVAAGEECEASGNITLRVVPVPGHCSVPEWHDEAAEWLLQTVVASNMERRLPAGD